MKTSHFARLPQFMFRLATDSSYRALIWLRLRPNRQLHQTTAYTELDRYPEIFAQCRTLLAGGANVRILSFGCSTGEEVITLRRYFPEATLIGAEINPHSLRVCRALPTDARMHFIESRDAELEKYAPYDAIFCMAVLQRTPHHVERTGLTDLSRLYPFEKFALQVAALDHMLKPDGLLIIKHTPYRLSDTAIYPHYRPEPCAQPNATASLVFDASSRLIVGGRYDDVIFRKLSDGGTTNPR